MNSDERALRQLIESFQTNRTKTVPITAPLSELPRLLAAGLEQGYDFRCEPVGNEERWVARSTAAERWMVPQAPEANGRAPSRRFIPTPEQAHHSDLLMALYKMGASESEALEQLFHENERRRAEWMRLAESCPFPLRVPVEKP